MHAAMQVFVKMSTGKTLQVDIEDPMTNTCLDLKKAIGRALLDIGHQAAPPHQQILSFSSMFPCSF